MSGARPWALFWILVATASCGGGTAETRPRDPIWPATPPTQTLACGAPLGACPSSASLRIRWPEGAHAPSDAQITLDGSAIAPGEVELGACAAPGMHALRIATALSEADGSVSQRGAALSIEILAGVETRVVLARGATPIDLATETTLVQVDVGATVATLRDVALPTLGLDATPEERRVFAPTLAAAFDAWRERLARVAALAESTGDVMLRSAATHHQARAEAIRATIEERPSADRLAAIQRAMQTEVEEAAGMIAIERACPLYSHRDPAPPLAPLALEARRYTGQGTFVARLRVAVDDVEVLDTGWADEDAVLDASVVEGLVPPGDHVVRAEATFAGRPLGLSMGDARRLVVLREAPIVVALHGTRVRVRALEVGTPTTPIEERLTVEIVAE